MGGLRGRGGGGGKEVKGPALDMGHRQVFGTMGVPSSILSRLGLSALF